ncbi:DnaA N-terminal domain-containing protein [Oceanobacillus timonensis]|uniref:DnaA N-terminal domain-containing protein n=1 Tax=Oceanobacillus timonensis TaxID=1926285 RepID=UPI0009B9FA0A|nr:DnaA N-terminal domain-containing protein [Oceanobacillus timonensis]
MDIWQKVLEKLSWQLSKPSFDTWLKNTTVEWNEDELTVFAANTFTADWLEDQYSEWIGDAVKEVTGEDYIICFAVSEKDADSIFSDTRLQSFSYETDSISRLETKIDRLEEKVQQLIDVKRLDERATMLEEKIRELEEQMK